MNEFLSLLALFCFCAIFGLQANATETRHDLLDATVYYFDFEISRATGISEREIELYGCIYRGNYKTLTQLADASPPSDERYEPGDIRVKVVGAQGEHFFIDSHGVTRRGSKFVKIDRSSFARQIYRDMKFRCPRKH